MPEHTKAERRKNRERKKLLGQGSARRAGEDLDSRRRVVDEAVDAAVSGKSANTAKQNTVKRERKKGRKRGRTQASPSMIQKVLDAVFGF